MDRDALEIDDTPVWRIYREETGSIGSVLAAWYTSHVEARFLTRRTFGTKREADAWLKEFWHAYWQLC